MIAWVLGAAGNNGAVAVVAVFEAGVRPLASPRRLTTLPIKSPTPSTPVQVLVSGSVDLRATPQRAR